MSDKQTEPAKITAQSVYLDAIQLAGRLRAIATAIAGTGSRTEGAHLAVAVSNIPALNEIADSISEMAKFYQSYDKLWEEIDELRAALGLLGTDRRPLWAVRQLQLARDAMLDVFNTLSMAAHISDDRDLFERAKIACEQALETKRRETESIPLTE